MSDRIPAIAFVGSRLLLRVSGDLIRLPSLDELAATLGTDALERGKLPTAVRFAAESIVAFGFDDDEVAAPEGFRLDGLRVAYHALGERDFRAAGIARQKVEWYRTHRFCSRCGTATELDEAHEAMRCPACGQLHFPRVAPAVIVLVERGGEALLGRSPRFQDGVYSTLAGFVEPGESLEECVHREIQEEVGVRVTNLRYFGSQPHPFPHSLMIGFVADWIEGEVRIDPIEIEDARWFRPDALPALPHPMSIARALIEDFVRRNGGRPVR
jgi:NAD+ diphosphatase